MNDFLKAHKPLKVAVTLTIEHPNGEKQIIEVPNGEVGPGISFVDYNGVVNETHLEQYMLDDSHRGPEMLSPYSSHKVVSAQDIQQFFKLKLLIRAKPAEAHGNVASIFSINTAFYHELEEMHVCSKTRATYKCVCGARGTATMASHLGSIDEIAKRVRKNHELHAVRARMKVEKK